MRGIALKSAGCVLSVAVAVFATAASAQTQTVYLGSSATFNLPVTASVGGSCGFADTGLPSGSYDVGELNNSFSQNVPFMLKCTVASRVAVVSANGGLLTAGTPSSGYSALAPYSVKLHLEGESGAGGQVEGSCAAADLTNTSVAACAIRGPASQTIGLRLPEASYNVAGSYLQISSPGYSGSDILVASNGYADTLTVTLSAAP